MRQFSTVLTTRDKEQKGGEEIRRRKEKERSTTSGVPFGCLALNFRRDCFDIFFLY